MCDVDPEMLQAAKQFISSLKKKFGIRNLKILMHLDQNVRICFIFTVDVKDISDND